MNTAIIILLIAIGLFFSIFLVASSFKKNPKTIEHTQAAGKCTEQLIGLVFENKRSYNKGDSLTPYEFHSMRNRVKNNLPTCVDCSTGELVPIEEKSRYLEYRCNNKKCRSEIRITYTDIVRITKASPEKVPEMVSLSPPYR